MNNMVYYGQYSLSHWVKLLLTKNIELPEYQRSFVWKEDDLIKLIDSFKGGYFVPPITIGSFRVKGNEKRKNLIIDGQQRLTCLLLAMLEIFPDKKQYKQTAILYNGEIDDNESSDLEEYMLEWNFRRLTDIGSDKETIMGHESIIHYKRLNLSLPQNFFDEHYLGFSYIIPSVAKIQDNQNQYFSRLFRSLNTTGMNLQIQESRKALYYLNDNFTLLFEPTFAKDYVIKTTNRKQMDFTRYLCFLFAYKKSKKINKVGAGYAKNIEKYIEHFVFSIVSHEQNEDFDNIDTVFKNGYVSSMIILGQTIEEFGFEHEFQSIIDMDLCFFGLIYWTFIENKQIDLRRKIEIIDEIKKEVKKCKKTQMAKSPSSLKYIRNRLKSSICLYKQFIV